MNIETFFKTCPRSGRIVGLKRSIPLRGFLWPVVGVLALAWFCARTLTRPSRIGYPCQQAVAPVAAGFLVWAGTLMGSWSLFRTAKALWKHHKPSAATALVGAVGMVVLVAMIQGSAPFAQQAGLSTGTFVRRDSVNTPIGTARGIRPGRVSWAHDSAAVLYNGQGSYTEERNFDQARLDNMLRRLVISVPGGTSLRGAWDSLFAHNNRLRGRPSRGYAPRQTIAIKVNCNSEGSLWATDQTPQLVRSLLRQLVDTMGVAQSDILVFDAIRQNGTNTIKSFCQAQFPSVRYNDYSPYPMDQWVDTLKYSKTDIPAGPRMMRRWVAQADYLINMAILKRHTTPATNWSDPVGQSSITVTGKNQCGSIQQCEPLHRYFRDFHSGHGTYNAVVDLMSGSILHDKTVLFLVDALFTANRHDGSPLRWKMAPFNGRYPSSVFASQDQVAMESVALDFLNAEMGLTANADNFLHEAAQIGNPPSGTVYANRGTNASMGVHEHWNNPVDKKYSRNLGNGQGIELHTVALSGSTTTVGRPGPSKSGIEFSPGRGSALDVFSISPLVEAEVFDLGGRMLKRIPLSGHHATLNPDGAQGATYLRVRTTRESATRILGK